VGFGKHTRVTEVNCPGSTDIEIFRYGECCACLALVETGHAVGVKAEGCDQSEAAGTSTSVDLKTISSGDVESELPTALDYQSALDKLKSLKGADFSSSYVERS
jgi:hypothetical protein